MHDGMKDTEQIRNGEKTELRGYGTGSCSKNTRKKETKMETCDRCGREIPSGAWYIHADGASYCSAGCFHADGWKDSDMDDGSPVCWTLNGDEYPGFEDSFPDK